MNYKIYLSIALLFTLSACTQPGVVTEMPASETQAEAQSAQSTDSDASASTEAPIVEETTEEPAVVEEIVEESTQNTEDQVAEQPSEAEVVEAEAAPSDIDWLTVSTLVDAERSMIGNPDAPVTMVEFSDFM